jgi:sec-independent protein translocase protein TatA
MEFGVVGGMGVPELLLILAVCLLIFGPKNLPKLGSAMGKTVKNIRDGMEGKDEAAAIDAAPVAEAPVAEAPVAAAEPVAAAPVPEAPAAAPETPVQ